MRWHKVRFPLDRLQILILIDSSLELQSRLLTRLKLGRPVRKQSNQTRHFLTSLPHHCTFGSYAFDLDVEPAEL